VINVGVVVDDRLVMVGVRVGVAVDAGAYVGAASVVTADDGVGDTTVRNAAVAMVADATVEDSAMTGAVDDTTVAGAAVAVSAGAEAGAYGDSCEGRLCCEGENCGDCDG